MKTLIAIPCGDQCPTDFLRALLSLEIVGQAQFTFAQGSLVYDARNRLTEIALEGDFDRVLWLDSDMSFLPDMMKRFSADLDEGREMVCGLYVTRKAPIKPTIYSHLGLRKNPGEKFATPEIEVMDKYPKDQIFEVVGCGFGGVMMTTDLLRRVADGYGAVFSPATGFGEDLSFCLRVRDMGEKIWCDSQIRMGHIGVGVYFPEE